jgi:NADPH:quinone reductase-like Zn-dependent oxidoreductase
VASATNHELVRRLGAERVIDYRSEHFADVLRDQDVVFDTIGRESLASAGPALARGGTYITTIPSARTARQSLGARLRRLLPGGRGHRARVVLCRADGGDLATLAGWLAEGRMESLIDSVYPLADVAAAHERSRSWRSRGKLILDVIAPDEDAPRADRAGDESCSV